MNELTHIPHPEDAALNAVPRTFAELYGIIPLQIQDSVLSIIAESGESDSLEQATSDLSNFLGLDIVIARTATRDQIFAAIHQYYPPAAEYLTVDEILQDIDADPQTPVLEKGFLSILRRWMGGGANK